MYISVQKSTSLARSATAVREFLWDLKNLARFEPKVDRVTVAPESTSYGSYVASGRFAGLPYQATFSYERKDNGLDSKMLSGPRGVSSRGIFIVVGQGNRRCTVTHIEQYEFPGWSNVIRPLLKAYLNNSISREMRNLKSAMSMFRPRAIAA